MKTNVASTSIDCYHSLKDTGALTARQTQIMGHIQHGRDYTLQELSKLSGLGVNTVSGRCCELRKKLVLELAGKRRCSITGESVNPVRLPSVQPGIF